MSHRFELSSILVFYCLKNFYFTARFIAVSSFASFLRSKQATRQRLEAFWVRFAPIIRSVLNKLTNNFRKISWILFLFKIKISKSKKYCSHFFILLRALPRVVLLLCSGWLSTEPAQVVSIRPTLLRATWEVGGTYSAQIGRKTHLAQGNLRGRSEKIGDVTKA